MELAQFLDGFTIVNGFGERRSKLANGMGCLAAQIVANFKTEVGNFYLYPISAKDCGQDYEYHVYKDKVIVKSYNGNQLFSGSWAAFKEFCASDE